VTLARLWAVWIRSRHVVVPLRGDPALGRGCEALACARCSPPPGMSIRLGCLLRSREESTLVGDRASGSTGL
jgi:hypothetical protein